MDPVRIAVIGAGIYGSLHLEVLRQLRDQGQAELVAVAARTEETVDKQSKQFGIRGYTDWRRMLEGERLDAVTIATPDHLHYDMTMAAIEAGIHVLVEKPMVLKTDEAEKIVARADEKGILVAVDYHKRFDPTLIAVKDMLAAPETGVAQYGYMYLEERLGFATHDIASWVESTNPSWIVGIHCYDVLRWLLESEVARVSASSTRRKLVGLGINALDSTQVQLVFESGTTVAVHNSWILPNEFEGAVDQALRLITDNAVIEADLQYRGLRATIGTKGTQTPNPLFLRRRKRYDGTDELAGYAPDAIANFVGNAAALLGGAQLTDLQGYYPSAEDGLEGVRTAAAVDESIRTGRPVSIQRQKTQ